MEYIRIGNFEVWPDQLNWSVPGKPEDYIGMPQKYYFLLDRSSFNELIESKIGKGWRLPDLNEMTYIGDISYPLGITKSKKLYIPTAHSYMVQETMDPSSEERKTFFSLENRTSISMPWIPGYFLTNAGKRTFKIQPVRDV
jgi:hypothetical protein